MNIQCPHAEPGSNSTHVTCKLNLYGGNPHVALCRQCVHYPSTGTEQLDTNRVPSIARVLRRGDLGVGRGRRKQFRSKAPCRRLVLRNSQSPGDVLMLTAAVRDLHRAYPGQFEISVETSCLSLWENNPYVIPKRKVGSGWRTVHCQYPLIHSSNSAPYHFIHGFAQHLESQLGVKIPLTEFRGDIHLSAEEKSKRLLRQYAIPDRFWIVMAGGKYDFTAKWWDPLRYQAIVDHFENRLTFVQCGEAHHWHPPLKDAINLVGKTSLRQFIELMHHASGVICPVTFAMHAAAAVPTSDGGLRPCIVIAGGREPTHWEAYPGHQYLHTVGMLKCCASGGCWRSRCQPVGDGDSKDNHNRCELPVVLSPELQIPRCMDLITTHQVVTAIQSYLDGALQQSMSAVAP